MGEFAVRQWWQFMGSTAWLPNPDPVLRSEGRSIAVYRSMVDGHLGGVLRKRRAGVRARPWRIDQGAADSRITEIVGSMFRALAIRDSTTAILKAPAMGSAFLEVIWGVRDGWVIPVELRERPQEWFVWTADGQLRFLPDSGLPIEVPPRKVLVARHDPDGTNPYGYPLLSECFWPLTFKRGGLRFWLTFTERFGSPWVVGKVPESTTSPERDALLGTLQRMVADAVAVINDGDSIEIKESGSKSGSSGVYADLVRWADAEMSKSILGETLSTELPAGSGSRAAAQTHNEVRADLALDDAAMVESVYNQLIDWVCEVNAPGAPRPRFQIAMPEDLQEARGVRDQRLAASGVTFTAQYYADIYGIRPEHIAGIGAAAKTGLGSSEYSEASRAPGRDCCGGGSLEFAEQELTALLGAVTPEQMQGQMEELIRPILDLASKSASFAEFDAALERLFPNLEHSQFQDAMEKCLLLAEMQGKVRDA